MSSNGKRLGAVAAAAFTAIAFAAVSLMMFGFQTWAAFLHSLPESSRRRSFPLDMRKKLRVRAGRRRLHRLIKRDQ